MRALTLWEPWASLIAKGVKTIETRSWPTRYRGPLLIHAAKRRVQLGEWAPGLHGWLAEMGVERLPRYGEIVAVAQLVDVAQFPTLQAPAIDHIVGDTTHGRWGWVLQDVKAIPQGCAPICTGQRGLWTPSDALVDSARRCLAEA